MTAVDTQCWGTDLQGGGAWEGLWCLLGSLSHSQGVLGGLVGECMFTREIRDSVSGASTADRTVSEMLLPCLVLDQLGRSAKKKKIWCLPVLPSLENFPTDPCLSGTHPKISQWAFFLYTPGAFQAAASVLNLRVRLCTPFKSKVLVSSCPLALLDKHPISLKARHWGGWSSWCRHPGCGVQCGVWTPGS